MGLLAVEPNRKDLASVAEIRRPTAGGAMTAAFPLIFRNLRRSIEFFFGWTGSGARFFFTSIVLRVGTNTL